MCCIYTVVVPRRHHLCRLCSDALIKDKTRLRVDLQDVKLFDPDLGACLQQSPTEYLPLVGFEAMCTQLQQHACMQYDWLLLASEMCLCCCCSLRRQPENVFNGVTDKRMRHKCPVICKSFCTVLLSLAQHP